MKHFRYFRALSTRTLAAMWWLFTLILVSSYTANLVAFLTTPGAKPPFSSAKELAKLTEVKYGVYCCGFSAAFLHVTTTPMTVLLHL